ncbi:hypothetical protein [Sphingomonas jatrophae]|uniref:Phage integrase family protein n=1 Tax=Sphingomonas jatrophae TaxID=1166337 RepID=A0A1I6K7Q8_9SPHN|nr:hypothetical protein [Sphingomonas jatrophae]SFR86910.1 hypothetical protein SAMN05192580_1387 [Sphingomonas jatrophae]
MARFTIPYLVVKPLAAGGFGYYWQPSPALTKKGWKAVNLGIAASDQDPERQAAARRRNDEVAAWRAGGAQPKAVKKFTRRHTVADLIAAFREHIDTRVEQGEVPVRQRNPTLGKPMSANTRKTYFSALNIVEIWATDRSKPGGDGNLPIASIDDKRVAAFRDGLMKPAKKGEAPRHHRAHNTLRVLRTLFEYGERNGMVQRGANPAAKFDLETPAPRDQVWDEAGGTADIDAFRHAAAAIGYPSLGLAVAIAEFTAQREADVLGLTPNNWQDVSLLIEPAVRSALADEAGVVMGFVLRQNKTKRPVGIPIVGPLRRDIEAAIAANRARAVPATTIIVDDVTERSWKTRQFIRKFNEARALAIAPTPEARAAGVDPRPSLEGLQFRDLRRTCVVRLGELGIADEGIASITGHSPRTIKKMLEIYMPRTTNRAAITILARHGDQRSARPAAKDGTAA